MRQIDLEIAGRCDWIDEQVSICYQCGEEIQDCIAFLIDQDNTRTHGLGHLEEDLQEMREEVDKLCQMIREATHIVSARLQS